MPPGRKPRPMVDRIKESVIVDPDTGCWVWQKARNEAGYGRVGTGSRSDGTRAVAYAHRVSYELHVGQIPPGLHIDHLCRNSACVNPDHLEPVTARENVVNRGQGPVARQADATHCKRGHEFTEANTYVNRGKRYCRACNRDRQRAYIRRVRALTT